jgi:hypothetical protein
MPSATKAPAKQVPDTSQLEKQAITALRSVVAYDTKRTQALKHFASILVNIRKHMADPAGTSQAYRDAAERIYKAVDIPADSASHVQASVRYHIGNELRVAFKPEELTAVGLSTQTPLERAREARIEGPKAPAPTPARDKAAEAAAIPPVLEVKVGNGDSLGAQVLQPANPPKVGRTKEKRDYTERPRVELTLPPDPQIILGASLDALRATVSLPEYPGTEIASLRDMVRRMRLELDRLEARLAGEEAPAPRKSTTAARKTTKAA